MILYEAHHLGGRQPPYQGGIQDQPAGTGQDEGVLREAKKTIVATQRDETFIITKFLVCSHLAGKRAA